MSIKSRLRGFFRIDLAPHQRFAVWSTLVLYTVAAVSILCNVLGAEEWRTGFISTSFLVTVILVPFLSIAASFAIQIIALFLDMRWRENEMSRRADFLAALERCRDSSVVSGAFLMYLLQDWSASMARLQSGIVTIQSDYWSVCAKLYDFAHDCVECTSLVPLKYWDETDTASYNKELLGYKNVQAQKLVAKNIKVKRTFVLRRSDYQLKEDCERFLRVVTRQMTEGFLLYFIVLDEFDDQPELQELLAKDFALIDDKILMLGRVSGINQSVYHYDFFELPAISRDPKAFEPALRLFVDSNQVIARGKAELIVAKYRKRIDAFERLGDGAYLAEKQAIDAHIQRLRY